MPALSNEFKDKENRTWRVNLTLGKAYDIDSADKRIIGKDFTLVPPSEDFFEKDIFNRRIAMFIVWHCIKDQAGKINLSCEDFLNSLEGEHIQNAMLAFYKAMMDFFPERAIYLSEVISARNYAYEKVDQITREELKPTIQGQIDIEAQKLKTKLQNQRALNQPQIKSGETSI